jgi:CcmD family protein
MNSIRFMVAAYLATWMILGGYLGSMALRYNRLRRQVRELSERGK